MTTLKHTPPPVTTNHLQSQKVDCGCEPGWVMNSDLLFPLIYESIPQEIKTHKCNLFKGIFHPKINSVIIYSPSNLHIPTTLDPIDFHCIDKKRGHISKYLLLYSTEKNWHNPFIFAHQCATIQKSATKTFSNISHQIHPSSNDLRCAIICTLIARLLLSNNKCLICFWFYFSS